MTTRLLLVRHGQIDANTSQHWHGSTDSPLNVRGRAQARAVATALRKAHPHARAVYTSPLVRTRDTAAAIGHALGLEPQVDDDLREYGIGELEGTHYRELMEHHGFYTRILAEPDYAPPGGESLAGVVARMAGALRRIHAAHAGDPGHPHPEVVVVSHGAAMALAIASLLHGRPDDWMRYPIGNCSITEVALDPEPQVLRLSADDHLGAADAG